MIKNITNVRGIRCWGAHTGIKSLRRDLALIFSEKPANVGAVFTQNEVVAEPIKISKKNVSDGTAQAIIVNSGNANACTGEQGYKGAEAMVKATAKGLNIKEQDVLVASTGIIGEPFPTNDILKGIKDIAPKVSKKSSAGSFAANAILTTDTYAKEGFLEFKLDEYVVNMGGIAKGSGMIHPNMATMLCFIVTDAAIEQKLLQETVEACVNSTFNMITVDGDTSTNDMVVVLANGMAENDLIKSKKNKWYTEFRKNLEELMSHLAQLIVLDGEGASKFVQYDIINAADALEARKIARTISDSSLVKTAVFGRDPNWGRIVAAAGNAGVPFNYEKIDLYLGNDKQKVKLLEQGKPQTYNKSLMKNLLRESQIFITLDMCQGNETARAWGTDLTTDYVLFNSVYTT